MKHLIILILFLVFGFCCAFGQKKNELKEVIIPTETGIVFGSISLENRKNIVSSHSFFYTGNVVDSLFKKYEKKKWKYKNIINSFSIVVGYQGQDYNENGKRVFLFYIKKPVGKYKFHKIELLLNTGYMTSTWEIPIEVPFEIEENKTKYIGELNLNVKGSVFKFLDNFKADSARFIKRFPELNLSNAQ